MEAVEPRFEKILPYQVCDYRSVQYEKGDDYYENSGYFSKRGANPFF